jgi:hypothetical protein
MMQTEMSSNRKSHVWLLVTVVLLLALGGSTALTWIWFEREQMSVSWDWDSGSPISTNLVNCLHVDWGGKFSIVEDPEPRDPGGVAITYQQWCVGPFMVRRVIYRNARARMFRRNH